MSSVQHGSDKITGVRFAQSWRSEKYGDIHAEVRLGDSSLVFDDAAEARAVAAECVKAAEALEALEAEGKSSTEGSEDDG